MNPKEKAEELIEKYLKLDIEIGGQYDGYLTMKMHDAKQCALIAVEEILSNNCGSHTDEMNATNSEIYCDEYFWNECKKEIEKL
jgi:hypothetical protein